MVHDQLTPSLKHPAFEEQGRKAYFAKRELVHKSHVRERTLKYAVALLLAMFLCPCIDIDLAVNTVIIQSGKNPGCGVGS